VRSRELIGLALPALGALAAEPLYLLVDTAIVGHLGTPQLAALALAATVLGTTVNLCIFLTYGTTARVSRLHGAGEHEAAAEVAPQAVWLATALGCALALLIIALADALVALLGGEGRTAELAARYLRISALGIPLALIALAGQGWLRGVGDLRTPLLIVVVAQAVNVVLELLFVYGFGWGLDGSAAGTVIAQLGMGGAFAYLLLRGTRERRPVLARMRPLLSIGAQLLVRTGALLACFTAATIVLANAGAPRATMSTHNASHTPAMPSAPMTTGR
jgi:putative MATE family efflux protein